VIYYLKISNVVGQMFCSECGQKIKDNSKFCSFCGANQILEIKVSPQEEEKIDSLESHTLGVDKSFKKTLRLMMYGFCYGVIILCSIAFINKILTKGEFETRYTLGAASAVWALSRIKEDKYLN